MFLRLPPQGGNPRQISEVVNRILEGGINSTGSVTIVTASAPVTVTDARVGADSVILLMPMDQDASGLLAHCYFSSVTNGQFVISLRVGHSSVTANYRYVVLG
jgi:hypothetical protein